jgi:23S rRNA G2069 N7-methylase RlmK/C1962 C5-methylase RlmI
VRVWRDVAGSVWSAKSDYGRLVKLAAPVVAPSGYIVAFNNTRSRYVVPV